MAAVVTLQGVWMNALLNPTDSLLIPTATAITDEPDDGGTIRVYAGGRLRAINPQGTQRKITLTLTLVTPAVVAWLESHISQVIVLRDYTGMRRFVTFFSWSRAPRSFGGWADITNLICQEITATDVV